MRWLLDRQPGILAYQLQHQNGKLAEAVYNPQLQSLRLYYSTKRLFLLQQKGWLQKKTLFYNEYGIEVGYFQHNKADGQRMLLVNGQQFWCYLQDGGEAVIYDQYRNSIAACTLAEEGPEDGYALPVMLFSLVWLHLQGVLNSEAVAAPAS